MQSQLSRLGVVVDYTIRPVTRADAKAVSRIMTEVQREVWHSRDGDGRTDFDRRDVRDFFVISDLERVRHKLASPDGFGYVAEAGAAGDAGMSRVVAYHLAEMLSADDPDSLGRLAGIPESGMGCVAEMDSVAVLPAWRGLGLQRGLAALCEEEATQCGCRHLVATVHPRNAHSLGNFLAMGYRVAAQVEFDVPESRVLSDSSAPGEPTVHVERLVLRKDL